MKYLILFLISFSTYAGYISILDIEKCRIDPNAVYTIHINKKTCGETCKETQKDFNCNTHTDQDTQVNDLLKPKFTKNEIDSCLDEASCEVINTAKTCTDIEERVLVSKDFTQVYCSKPNGYFKKTVKVIREDAIKKADFDQDILDKENIRKAINDSLKNIRLKVRDSLPLNANEIAEAIGYLLKNVE